MRLLFFVLVHSAAITAIANVLPIFFPFLSPGKRTITNETDLLRKMLFFDRFFHARPLALLYFATGRIEKIKMDSTTNAPIANAV
jgi:hypothetical protein